jgi:ABC-type proline/glycine betaine transport system substrate-binding protein
MKKLFFAAAFGILINALLLATAFAQQVKQVKLTNFDLQSSSLIKETASNYRPQNTIRACIGSR